MNCINIGLFSISSYIVEENREKGGKWSIINPEFHNKDRIFGSINIVCSILTLREIYNK